MTMNVTAVILDGSADPKAVWLWKQHSFLDIKLKRVKLVVITLYLVTLSNRLSCFLSNVVHIIKRQLECGH